MSYDEKGRLTYAGAKQVIESGGSVSVRGRIISTVDKLPNEAEFAKGDPKSEADAKIRLQQTIKDAQQQLEALSVAPEKTTAPAAAEDLDALTVVELKERAKDAGIPGAGSMHKDELVAALKKR